MLALFAGTGALPAALVARLEARPLVVAMDGFAPEITADITFRIERLGSLLEELRGRGVDRICMAGAVRRPVVDPAAVDAATGPLVPRIVEAIAAGDDGALRAVIGIFEEAGFAVLAAHEVAPDLLPEAGVPTVAQPGVDARRDAGTGDRALVEMGRADSGQACVIAGGHVIAREGPNGTDAMLARLAPVEGDGLDVLLAPADLVSDVFDAGAAWLGGDGARPLSAAGGILFKAPKPGQDRRADLPVIGPETARRAVAAGLAGIVIEAGGVMVLDLPEVVRVLDAAGLFLWVR